MVQFGLSFLVIWLKLSVSYMTTAFGMFTYAHDTFVCACMFKRKNYVSRFHDVWVRRRKWWCSMLCGHGNVNVFDMQKMHLSVITGLPIPTPLKIHSIFSHWQYQRWQILKIKKREIFPDNCLSMMQNGAIFVQI